MIHANVLFFEARLKGGMSCSEKMAKLFTTNHLSFIEFIFYVYSD